MKPPNQHLLDRVRARGQRAADRKKPSDEHWVKHYTEILTLPFRVATPGEFNATAANLKDIKAYLEKALQHKRSGWQRHHGTITATKADSVAALPEWTGPQHFAAYAYFHPTVRSFLFDPGQFIGGNDYVARFTYPALKSLKVVTNDYGTRDEIHFEVVRCELILFQPDTAILQLELRAVIDAASKGISLRALQSVRDQVRRIHPPYFNSYERKNVVDGPKIDNAAPNVTWSGGHFPVSVELLGAEEKPLCASAPVPLDKAGIDRYIAAGFTKSSEEYTTRDAESFVIAPHWKFLLAPFVCSPDKADDRQLRAVLPGDDRMPIVSFIAVDDPLAITRGDWMRLTFADAPGDARLPYSRDFMQDFESRFCYDRFWHNPDDSSDKANRILNCGYAFTWVGSSADHDYFLEPTNGAMATFRQVYSRMSLIAHFQKTALLNASARLAALSNRNDRSGRIEPYEGRQHKIIDFYQHFIEFTHVFWFDEVSPQEQGVQLFAMWQRELRTKELYNEIRQELKDLVEYVNVQEAREQTEATKRFARVAAWLGGLGVVAGLLGVNFFDKASFDTLALSWKFTPVVSNALVSALVAFAVWCVGSWAWKRKPNNQRAKE